MHRATRRISILLIAMFAFSGLALAGTAGASTPAKSADSCAAQVKKFATINGLSSKDAQDPANLGKIAGKVANV